MSFSISTKNTRIEVSDIISYLCIAFASFVCFRDELNTIALYGALPLAFLICFYKSNVIRNNIYMRILLILYLWVCFCYPFAGDSDMANREMRRVLGAFILFYSMGALAQKKELLPWLYCIFIFLLINAWIYAKNNILTVIDFGQERLNDEKLNANTLAYYTFYVTIAIFLIGEIISNYLKKWSRIALFGMIFVSFITAIYTGSRQVLILQVPLLCILLWDRYLRKSGKSVIILLVVVVCSIALYLKYGQSVYENSTLKSRSEANVKDDSRFAIAEECIELGLKEPLVGYGPGNSVANISTGHFAHNTFLELWVNTGIPGMLIFGYLIYKFIAIQYKRWRATKDRMFFTFLVFGLFWLFDQVFYVFYTDLWLMSFFMLVATHSEQYYLGKYRNRYYLYNNSKL